MVLNKSHVCFLITGFKKSSDDEKILLYFHGNAEDLYMSIDLLHQIKSYYGCSVLAMEYPGYGFFKRRIINRKSMQHQVK
jgi:hypothetical protein